MNSKVISRAILSVSDKKGLSDFARYLQDLGVELISTGGTAKYLDEEGVAINEVSEFTNFPEMLDGRVKTLHPKIHGGILAIRNNTTHQKEMKYNKISPIDMVVVNLYPFEETVSSGASESKCIENIDIGGPAMIRSSAKNFMHVVVITDPNDYKKIEEEMRANSGCVLLKTRKYLAAKAFSKTAFYDSRISKWFLEKEGNNFPELFSLSGTKSKDLRYGENPHQNAALYLTDKNINGVSNAQQLQGKELSYNNINDTDAAYELVKEFNEPAVAIIKHANPCGVALGETCEQAYLKALRCDRVSAFGGVIAVNRTVDKNLALKILDIFTEVIIAPDFSEGARRLFSKKKNLRLLMTDKVIEPVHNDNQIRLISGGFLLQNKDNHILSQENLNIVTTKLPTSEQVSDMLFAFTVAKHVKSNAIIYVKDGATVGIGAGQMSRVDSSRIAAEKAKEAANKAGVSESLAIGSVVASDAFFPFPDGLIAAIDAGAEAVIQPGGSIRDDDVISAANERNIAMVFTGIRHFKH
jgi:phosphoribosylaminoimidazolecarboxamide formyltransferase/IMP cyclohydrolase